MSAVSMRSKYLLGRAVVIAAVACLAAGCATVYNPATGRREFLFINSQEEASMGRDLDLEIRKQMRVIDGGSLQGRIDAIGARVAAVSDRRDLAYHFAVVDADDFNAFAIPGGYIYVNDGLMRAATDDELASVLAHEIGHVAAKHSVKQLQTVMGYQIIAGVASGVTGSQLATGAMDLVFNIVNKGYSRKDELLADALAVRYTRSAGYNPYGLVTFFQKLKEQAKERGPGLRVEFLSSHPDLDERIQKVISEIER